MGAPTVYRWDDANAPVCAGTSTSLVALFRACLVDGYGDKTPAGWTMPFINEGKTKAVFRNNPATGTGFYLRVNQNSTNPYYAWIRAYESMTDVDTGVNVFWAKSKYLVASKDVSTTSRPWVLIADDRILIFLAWVDAKAATFDVTDEPTYNASGLIFGDGISIHDTDAYFCVLFGSGAAYTFGGCYCVAYDLAGTATHDYPYQHVARNVGGENAETECMLTHGGGPMDSGELKGVRYGATRVVGAEIFSRPFVNEGVRYTMRGYIPGLWFPCHDQGDFNVMEEVLIDGHQFFVLSYSDGMFAVDISEHFRP